MFCLIIFKLFYRIIYWGYNPVWYVNFLILLINFIGAIRFDLYTLLRESIVQYVYKLILGKKFYCFKDDSYLDMGYLSKEIVYKCFIEQTLKQYPIKSSYDWHTIENKFINAIFINSFVFLIYIRLFIIYHLKFFLFLIFV